MRGGICDRITPYLRAALATLLFMGYVATAEAQEPPLDVPSAGVLSTPSDVLSYGGWLFYPEITVYAVGTDNLFQTPTSPISVGGVGYIPKLVTEWTDGMYRTTLYGNYEQRFYPSQSDLNVFNRNAGFTQSYSPLPDLKFSVQGDYTHLTNTSSLIGSIPGAVATPNPGGPPPPTPTLNVQGQTITVNPTDTYTAQGSIEKLFNRGIVTMTGAIAQTNYTQGSTQSSSSSSSSSSTGFTNYSTKMFSGNGAYWLGPTLYAFSDGTFATHDTVGDDSNAYRARGGVGTRQIGLFKASAYFGYQGSNDQIAGPAGGLIYGGSLSYYPTSDLTLTARIDETINRASELGTSNLALNLFNPTAITIALSSSTQITSPFLQAAYQISDQWSVFGNFGLTHIDYIGSPEVQNAWLADLNLEYKASRSWTFNWEYQYTAIQSNVPLNSSIRNYVYTSANYKF
jgi:hypothetical protein